MRPALLLLALAATIQAQWTLQPSPTTASLRGIHAVSDQIAWASGTFGTVLHTADGGTHWLPCATPPAAEHLDFRGVQAFDAQTAIVMSSGKGDLSRLYKTTDACQTWTLALTNPDKEGFWDAYQRDQRGHLGILFGDPVNDHFPLWMIDRDSSSFQITRFHRTPRSHKEEAAFAASNSAIIVADVFFDYWIATGGKSGAHIVKRTNHDFDGFGFDTFSSVAVPVGAKTQSSGVFSLLFRKPPENGSMMPFLIGVAVGGDYLKPEDTMRTAAFTLDGGKTWTAATTPPHGYRSAVAYNPTQKSWITVGPPTAPTSPPTTAQLAPAPAGTGRSPGFRPQLERPLPPLHRRPPGPHRPPKPLAVCPTLTTVSPWLGWASAAGRPSSRAPIPVPHPSRPCDEWDPPRNLSSPKTYQNPATYTFHMK